MRGTGARTEPLLALLQGGYNQRLYTLGELFLLQLGQGVLGRANLPQLEIFTHRVMSVTAVFVRE